jgi:hypothetical protein
VSPSLERERREGGLPGPLRAAALIAALAGAVGSVGLLLHAGQRSPRLLLALFVVWVLSPFLAFIWADAVSKRWAVPTRVTLYCAVLMVTLGSLAVYGDDARGHRRAQAAFVYVIVPPASTLLTVIAVGMASLMSGRLSRRDDGA